MLPSVNCDLSGCQKQPSPDHAVWGDVRVALQTVLTEDGWFLGVDGPAALPRLALDGIPEPLGIARI